MRAREILFLLGMLLVGNWCFGQFSITDPDYDQNNPVNCIQSGGIGNFSDDNGGPAGAYSNNFNDTIVFCPDLVNGSKISISFGINTGLTFDVDSTDSIYVYDGPDVNSPLLGVHNSHTDSNGFSYQASFANNATGCLTVVFVSDSDTVANTGWDATVACGNPAQPFLPHMQAFYNGLGGDTLIPADTGRVEMCIYDSILYVSSVEAPYSLENTGTGYSQHDSLFTSKWFFSNGVVLTGDSVWFSPDQYAGYVVTLQMTDTFPMTQQLISTIRVGAKPDFSATRSLADTICPGDTVALIAGITPTDTVGVRADSTSTLVGGSYAGLTYLPDGSGINYETTINITGYGAGDTVTASDNILEMCVTMEHSYLGDLEMLLKCPSGDTSVIFNSYSPGMIPGGFGGGGTYLGDADDGFTTSPGIGWTYCFSTDFASWGDMATEFSGGNTLPTTITPGQAMNPNGVYLPETSFDNFVGCPINGPWTIVIRDNLGVDDGYIFDWAIYFDPLINPNFETYTVGLKSAIWEFDNTIVGSINDTGIYVVPDTAGYTNYKFIVTDEYNCEHDTAVSIYRTKIPYPQTFDTSGCNNQIAVEVYDAEKAFWSTLLPTDTFLTFLPSAEDTSVNMIAPDTGFYQAVVNSQIAHCNFYDTISLYFIPDVELLLPNDTILCVGETLAVDAENNWVNVSYEWFPNEDTVSAIEITETGSYAVTVSGCQVQTDSIEVTFMEMPELTPPALVCDSLDSVSIDHVNLGGTWQFGSDVLSSDSIVFFSNDSLATVMTGQLGSVWITYYDSLCSDTARTELRFQHEPSVEILDSIICFEDGPSEMSLVIYPKSEDLTITWGDGSTDSVYYGSKPDIYKVTVENLCGTATDTNELEFIICGIMIPNVMTPNGDGKNDVFFIENLHRYGQIGLEVYNRWGKKLLQTDNYQNDWSGQNPGGGQVPEGTYFFRVTMSEKLSYNGSFTIFYD